MSLSYNEVGWAVGEQTMPYEPAPPAVILVPAMVGGVLLSEGIRKLLFPAALGVSRFTTIEIPAPQLMAPFNWQRS